MLGDISLEPLREGTREWAVPSPMEAVTSDLLVELSAQLRSENDPRDFSIPIISSKSSIKVDHARVNGLCAIIFSSQLDLN